MDDGVLRAAARLIFLTAVLVESSLMEEGGGSWLVLATGDMALPEDAGGWVDAGLGKVALPSGLGLSSR